MAHLTDVTVTSATPVTAPTPPPGRIGRYAVQGVLGAGGMGVVYAAYDADLERRVAIKVLRTSQNDGRGRARLLREARAMAKLTHRNVITVHEVGTDGDTDFVAMELIDGQSVADWMRGGAPRSHRDVLRLFRQAGDGLAAAHAAGLVHRDFKPHNVLVGRDGRVVVTDFGLARSADVAAGGAAAATSGVPLEETIDAGNVTVETGATPDRASWTATLTRPGAVVGTPAYMSPEQHAGSATDPRSDQFAFCITLWEALTGARPFPGATVEEVRDAITAGVPAAAGRDLPRDLRAVLVRGLAADPARRWPSMNDLLDALTAAEVRPRRRIAALAAGAVAAAIALAAVIWPRASAPSCALPASAIDAAWGPARRAALSPEVAALVARVFDRDLLAWSVIHADTCDAPAAPVHAARLECLRDAADQLDALVFAVAASPPDRVRAADVAALVSEPDVCGADVPPGVGAAGGDPRHAALRHDIARFRLDARAYVLDDIVGRAERLVEAARASGSCSLHAEALAAVAPALVEIDRAAGLRYAEAGVAEGARCGHDRATAQSAVALVTLASKRTLPADQMTSLLARAEAAVERAGRPIGLVAALRQAQAELSGDDPRTERALDALETTLTELRDADRLVEAAEVAIELSTTREVRGRGGDLAASIRLLRRAVDETVTRLGPDHPRTASARKALAGMLWYAGDVHAAAVLRDQVRTYWRSPAGVRIHDVMRPSTPTRVTSEGVVVDPGGRPVAGARVVGGPMIIADRDDLALFDYGTQEIFYTASTVTDGAGRFRLDLPERSALAAEAGALRSAPALAGTSVTLALGPLGRAAGKVVFASTRPSMVAAGTVISLSPMGPHFMMFAPIDPQGGFVLDRLPAGRYEMWIQGATDTSVRMTGQKVLIEPEQTTRVELSWSAGGAVLEVAVRAERGVIEAAQIWVTSAVIDVHTFAEMSRALAQSMEQRFAVAEQSNPDTQRRARELGGDVYARIDGLIAGSYSVCVLPLTSDLADPAVATRLQSHADLLHVTCQRTTVDAGTDRVLVIETAPMRRLPR